jgi:3-methyladenine DNA glycosylase/8-oxoguanine DNA glycosylase
MTRITVPTPPSFRFRPTLLSHGWCRLAPFAVDEAVTTLTRVERLADGTVVKLAVRGLPAASGGETLEVDVEGLPDALTARRREEVTGVIRHLFHLELDLAPFYERLRGEPGYAWVERSGAGRLLRSPTVWEDLAKTLMTTNTTWGGTRGMVRRICALGDPFPGAEDDDLHAFPTPEQVAALSPDDLAAGIRAGYRAPYLHELASAIAEGRLDVEAWAEGDLPAAELLARIRALKGFGPYAAGTVLKLLGGYAELALDSAARTMFSRRYRAGGEATDAEIRAHYERWGEWRGLVLWMDLLHEALGERIASA